MKQVKLVPVARKYRLRPFVFKSLATCTHVNIKNNAKKGLDPPYKGPYKIVSRVSEINYLIDVDGTEKIVNV